MTKFSAGWTGVYYGSAGNVMERRRYWSEPHILVFLTDGTCVAFKRSLYKYTVGSEVIFVSDASDSSRSPVAVFVKKRVSWVLDDSSAAEEEDSE